MKIAFLHGKGTDYFLQGIVEELSARHEVRVSDTTDMDAIQALLHWADVAWLEWAASHAHAASLVEDACPLVCRLHSYECFVPLGIVWKNISRMIFVSPVIEQLFNAQTADVPGEVMLNAVEARKFPLKASRQRTGKIACVSLAMNASKNLPYALQMFHTLWQDDPSLTLHLTAEPHGGVEEQRTFTYLTFMIANLGLKNHVFFEKNVPRDRMNDWLDDKDCLISASIFESFGYNIAEAMCKGIKPIINNFWGAGFFFPKQYIANTLDDVRRIYATPADPEALRAFIEKRYSPRRLAAQAEGVLLRAVEERSRAKAAEC